MNKVTLAAVALVLALGFQMAQADMISLGNSTLNVANVGGHNGPFGTVHISLNVTTQVATFTFTANSGGGYHFIGNAAAGINASTTFDGFTLITDSDFKGLDSGTVDGFGTFNLILDNNNASTFVDQISFSIHNTGTNWATSADVLAFNSKGADAVAHVNFGNGVTGFVAETGPVTVPDGGTTAMLLGMALSAFGLIRRFF